MAEWVCKVDEICPLTDTVTRVRLIPRDKVSFVCGQYLMLKLSEQDKRPFSIASCPGEAFIELHLGTAEHDSWAQSSLEHLSQHDEVVVDAPNGVAILQSDAEQPVILLAGGTGYSYVRSLLLGLMQQSRTAPVYLYWGVRQAGQLYEQQWLQGLASRYDWLHYVPVVQHLENDWSGRTGLVHQAIVDDFSSLAGYQIYAAGRFEMIAIARDAFVAQGVRTEDMFADAFAFI